MLAFLGSKADVGLVKPFCSRASENCMRYIIGFLGWEKLRYVSKYINVYVCVYIYMYMYIYVCIYIYIYINKYYERKKQVYIYMYVCICIYVHTHTHIYIYIYIYTPVQKFRNRSINLMHIKFATLLKTSVYIYIYTHMYIHTLINFVKGFSGKYVLSSRLRRWLVSHHVVIF